MSLINKAWKDRLYKYISGIITNKKQKLIVINGVADHIHILVSMTGSISVGELVKNIKEHSTKFINSEKLVMGKFQWQEGYGGFSCSKSHMRNTIHYIENQEAHHHKKTFREEYVELLEEYNIPYKEEYLFDQIKDVPPLQGGED